MQYIEIKSGTSAQINITPKIGGVPATASQLSGFNIYVFFVYQFTNKIHGEPYQLFVDSSYSQTQKLSIKLTPEKTLSMLGNARENQKYELQFAVQNADGDIIPEEGDDNIVVNIIRWEAGKWLQEKK